MKRETCNRCGDKCRYTVVFTVNRVPRWMCHGCKLILESEKRYIQAVQELSDEGKGGGTPGL